MPWPVHRAAALIERRDHVAIVRAGARWFSGPTGTVSGASRRSRSVFGFDGLFEVHDRIHHIDAAFKEVGIANFDEYLLDLFQKHKHLLSLVLCHC